MFARRLGHIIRTINTLRHLRPVQLFYFLWRRGIGARSVPSTMSGVRPRALGGPAAADIAPEQPPASHTFDFLNTSLEFPAGAIDWCPINVNRLWRYNLHYFDYLGDPGRSRVEKMQLLDSWITDNPQGSEPAWEPYTASLRITNWCKFLGSLPPAQLQQRWLDSLHLQARWLEKNLELHILANHYFENIRALLFAGAFFDDANARRWLSTFQRELVQQLRVQTLADGGHYERSPLYHCILLEGYLDLYALAGAHPALFEAAVKEALATALRAGLAVLDALATPDDGIPLFNDSANGIASRPSAILQRAQSLGLAPATAAQALVALPQTGLYGWKTARDYFLIDCGDIGPAYQPGHTHCDFLSYELMIDGRWLVVDSGVCEYEPGALRTYVRSTAAHNTVAVDAAEQSEVWGEFRVGRRARALAAELVRNGDEVVFEGTYRGFAQCGGAVHHRRAMLALDDTGAIRRLTIEDRVEASGNHTLRSFIHLHPSIQTSVAGDTATLTRDGVLVAIVRANDADMLEAATGWHCPEFGRKEANTVLILHRSADPPTQFGYTIELPAT